MDRRKMERHTEQAQATDPNATRDKLRRKLGIRHDIKEADPE